MPVTIRAKNGRPEFAQLTAAKAPELGPAAPSSKTFAEMLSLSSDDVLDGEMVPEGWSCGTPFVFVPLKNRAAVARARREDEHVPRRDVEGPPLQAAEL